MKITVRIKQVYGMDRIYPVCENAILFAKLAGQVTLSREHVETIRKLGFEVLTEQQVLAA